MFNNEDEEEKSSADQDFVQISLRERLLDTVCEYGIEGAEDCLKRVFGNQCVMTEKELLEVLWSMYGFGGNLKPITEKQEMEFEKIVSNFK